MAPRTPPPRPTLDLEALRDARRRWPPLALDDEAAAAGRRLQARDPSSLLVLTWNVWFDELCASDRQQALMRSVLAAAPDVACFQEVVPAFLDALRGSPALRAVYDISPQDIESYGCAMLVRRDLRPQFSLQPLPTEMGRSLLSAVFTARYPGLVVTTAHLESLTNRRLRREQLLLAAAALRPYPQAVLCGDFNFDDTKNWGDWRFREDRGATRATLENEVLQEVLPDYVDTWREVHPEDPGYTFDGATNGVCIPDSQERMRYDRLMSKRGTHGLVPRSAWLLGQEPMNEWGVRPSDHYGLAVELALEVAAPERS